MVVCKTLQAEQVNLSWDDTLYMLPEVGGYINGEEKQEKKCFPLWYNLNWREYLNMVWAGVSLDKCRSYKVCIHLQKPRERFQEKELDMWLTWKHYMNQTCKEKVK